MNVKPENVELENVKPLNLKLANVKPENVKLTADECVGASCGLRLLDADSGASRVLSTCGALVTGIVRATPGGGGCRWDGFSLSA